MKLFIKHLWRDLLRFPLRSLLIILTLSLSTAVAVSAFGIRDIFVDHARKNAAADAELGDIIITPTGADTRIIFDSNAKDVLGDKGEVLGEFRFSAFLLGEEESLVSVSATDLQRADGIYNFNFTKYAGFTTQSIDRSAILSESAAKRLSLGLGEAISVSILGQERSFTVAAIAEDTGLLANTDMLISINEAKSILAKENPAISLLGGSILPYTRLIVSLDDKAQAQSVALSLNERLDGCTASVTENSDGVNFSLLVEMGSITLLAALVVILAAMLNALSLRLLHQKRQREYALFALAGADNRAISSLKLAESGIYSLFSIAVGLPLASVILPFLASLFAWNTKTVTLSAEEIIFGILFAPAIILFTTALTIRRQKRSFADSLTAMSKENDLTLRSSEIKRPLIILALIIALTAGATLALHTAYKYIPAIITVPFVLALVYIAMPEVIRLTAKGCADRLAKRGKWRGILTLRAFENVYAFKQVCRLLTLLLALLSAIYACKAAVGEVVNIMEGSICAEYAVTGTDERTAAILEDDPRIDAISTVGVFAATDEKNGYTINAISASGDVDKCISEELLPSVMPHGRETVVSKEIARLCSLSVGDIIRLRIENLDVELTVIGICDNNINSIFIDAEALRLRNTLTAVKLKDGVAPSAELKRELTEKLEAYGSTVTSPSVIFGTKTYTASGFIDLLEYTLILSIVLIAIGFSDTLCAHYRERRREYRILRISGMSKRAMALHTLTELAQTVAIALLFAIPTGIALCSLLHAAGTSFGFSLFGLI